MNPSASRFCYDNNRRRVVRIIRLMPDYESWTGIGLYEVEDVETSVVYVCSGYDLGASIFDVTPMELTEMELIARLSE